MATRDRRAIESRPSTRVLASLATLLALTVAAGTTAALGQDDSSSPEPGPTGDAIQLPDGFDQKMARQVAKVIEAVHPVRGLPPAEDVAYRLIDGETFLTELEALFREEYPAAYIEAEDEAFTRLGLLEPDDDLGELILRIYDSQVLAYYDPASTTFTLIGPVEKIGPLESVVVAHEYGHALQDAEWDLDAWSDGDLDESDAMLAKQALVEGDATAIMYDWAARELKLNDLLRVSASALDQGDQRMLARMPMILQRQLEFPYIDGFAFVNAIRGRGDWDAVDAVWGSPPLSTEQILHPELYPDELPIEVEMPDIAAALGDGWTTRYEQTLGEMQIGVWVADGHKRRSLFPVLPGQLPKADAAAGWGGDRLVSLDGPDDAWTVVWQTEWDTARDQKEFRQAARDAMKDLPGAHTANDADIAGGLSSPVLVLVADSEGTLDTVREALGL